MKIRAATADDIPMMAELLHELFAIEADFTPDYALQCRGLTLLIEKPDAAVLVAEDSGDVIGMCSLQIHVSTAMGMEVGSVEDVVVDISHRGRGIGTALLQELEQWARQRSLGRLQLQADQDNHPALGFYRRSGWTRTNLIGWMKTLD